MNNKNLILLGVAAVVLGGAAIFLSGRTAKGAPRLNGQPLVRPFDVEQVAQIQATMAGSSRPRRTRPPTARRSRRTS